MYARLDDELLDHRKIFVAGAVLGKEGASFALALYVLGLLYANRHLTDGHLDLEVVKRFPHMTKPLSVADALVKAGLWEKNGSGFVIHDFQDWNPSAKAIKRKRKDDRQRKREERAKAHDS
jgi:hypothetical protein